MVDSVTVILKGDVDGNGGVDATDYSRLKAVLLGTFTFNEVEKLAADVEQNGIIDTTDYMRIKAHFLGEFDLYD